MFLSMQKRCWLNLSIICFIISEILPTPWYNYNINSPFIAQNKILISLISSSPPLPPRLFSWLLMNAALERFVFWSNPPPPPPRFQQHPQDTVPSISSQTTSTLLSMTRDTLPHVNQLENKLIKCVHWQLFGDFVAPEQFFDDIYATVWLKKIDIWS